MKNHYLNLTNPFRVAFYLFACFLFSACSIDTSNFTFDETEMKGVKAVQQYLPNAKLSIKKGVSVKTGSGKVKSYILEASYTENPVKSKMLQMSPVMAWAFYEQLSDSLRQKYDGITTKISGPSLNYEDTYTMKVLGKVQHCMGSASLFITGFIEGNSKLIEQSMEGNTENIKEIATNLTQSNQRTDLEKQWGDINAYQFVGFSILNDSTINTSFYLQWSEIPKGEFHRIDLTHYTESGKITEIDF